MPCRQNWGLHSFHSLGDGQTSGQRTRRLWSRCKPPCGSRRTQTRLSDGGKAAAPDDDMFRLPSFRAGFQ